MRMAAAGSLPDLLGGVLITHLHSDHICALNDVITTHWIRTREDKVLQIYGPIGTARFVERQIHAPDHVSHTLLVWCATPRTTGWCRRGTRAGGGHGPPAAAAGLRDGAAR